MGDKPRHSSGIPARINQNSSFRRSQCRSFRKAVWTAISNLVDQTILSGKGKQTFDDFVAQEQGSYRTRDPSRSSPVMGRLRHISPTRQSIHIANAQGERDELVVYVRGPTAFFIVVLTADSPAHEMKYRDAFDQFLASFSPATLQHGGGG